MTVIPMTLFEILSLTLTVILIYVTWRNIRKTDTKK